MRTLNDERAALPDISDTEPQRLSFLVAAAMEIETDVKQELLELRRDTSAVDSAGRAEELQQAESDLAGQQQARPAPASGSARSAGPSAGLRRTTPLRCANQAFMARASRASDPSARDVGHLAGAGLGLPIEEIGGEGSA